LTALFGQFLHQIGYSEPGSTFQTKFTAQSSCFA
jgi:hypothetical protein